MFWGNGDSTKLTEEERVTLAHLRRMVETGHISALSPKESETALAAIQFYGSWLASLRLLNSVKNVALLIGALLAIWWASQGAVAEWVRGLGP
jgi:hypothetical protein